MKRTATPPTAPPMMYGNGGTAMEKKKYIYKNAGTAKKRKRKMHVIIGCFREGIEFSGVVLRSFTPSHDVRQWRNRYGKRKCT